MPPSFRRVSRVLSHAPTRSFVPSSSQASNLAPWGTTTGFTEWWFDCSVTTSLHVTVGGANPTNPGVDRIAQIDDLSGNNRTWTLDGASSFGGIWHNNGLNSLGTVELDDASAARYDQSAWGPNSVTQALFMLVFRNRVISGRSTPEVGIPAAAFLARHIGFSNHALVISVNIADTGQVLSDNTGYWMYHVSNGDTTDKIRASSGTEQTGVNIFGASGPPLHFGNGTLGCDTSDANTRSNLDLCEGFMVSNPGASDLASAKLYVGNKWALPTS